MRAGLLLIVLCFMGLFLFTIMDRWLVIGLLIAVGPFLVWLSYKELG